MSTLRISDAPLLPDVDGTEKIPTGGRGDYAISVDQIKDHIFQDVGKELVGLGNVDNTSDLDKPVSTAQQTALNLKADKTYVDANLDLKADKTSVYTRSETSLALSKKADLINGVVPENQIPSSFNDVLEFITSNLPIVGESGKIYVTTDTNKTWRWGGNKYVEISGWNPDSVSKAATIPTYSSAVDGVDPVTGVANGAYFNVRSEDDDTVAFEYQNVGGIAVATGKSYPSSNSINNIPHNNLKNRDAIGAHPASSISYGVINQEKHNSGLNSISDMLAIQSPENGMRVYVKGFRAPTNLTLLNPYKGGGDFVFIESLSAQNDGISVFNGWVRLNITEVTPEMAGAYADFVTDDEDAFVKAQELARTLRLPLRLSGLYAKSKPFVCIPWDTVLGTNYRTTRIRKIGNATSGLAPRQAAEKPVGVTDDYDVDALLIFYPYDNGYADNITVKDIYFEQGEWGVNASRGYGFYAPRHAVCNTENLQFENVLVAFYAKVFWNCTHRRFGSVSGLNADGSKSGDTAMVVYDGEGAFTGTSNICEHFLFNNFKAAGDIQNLQTSTFTACYGENISKANGAEETAIWRFVNPHDLTLNGCGQESSYGTPLYILAQTGVPNCSIVLNGFQAVWGTNGTTTEKYINMLTIDGPVTVTANGSNFRKGLEGFLFDGFYLGVGSTLINNGSSLGASSVQQAGSHYIDVSKSITEKDGFSQTTKAVGLDLNNGWEDKAGLSVKSVQGANLNIPTGFTDVYGVSTYYGLNATQGAQFFTQIPSGNQYKRIRTAANSATPWVQM